MTSSMTWIFSKKGVDAQILCDGGSKIPVSVATLVQFSGTKLQNQLIPPKD